MRATLYMAFWMFLLICLLGCDGDGSSSSSYEPAFVSEVRVSPRTVPVGESTDIEVEFSPAVYTPGDTTDDDEAPSDESGAFDLVIRLPQGLDYVDGSSKLTDSFLGDVVLGNEDPRGPNEVGICPDNSRYLLYDFDFNELSVDTPLSTKISFKAQAYEAAGSGQIGAATRSAISAPCGELLEEVVAVDVVD